MVKFKSASPEFFEKNRFDICLDTTWMRRKSSMSWKCDLYRRRCFGRESWDFCAKTVGDPWGRWFGPQGQRESHVSLGTGGHNTFSRITKTSHVIPYVIIHYFDPLSNRRISKLWFIPMVRSGWEMVYFVLRSGDATSVITSWLTSIADTPLSGVLLPQNRKPSWNSTFSPGAGKIHPQILIFLRFGAI